MRWTLPRKLAGLGTILSLDMHCRQVASIHPPVTFFLLSFY
jgi:hypothetical protein